MSGPLLTSSKLGELLANVDFVSGYVVQTPTGVTSTVDLNNRYNKLDLSGTSAAHTTTLTVPTDSPRNGRILLVLGGYNVTWQVSSGTKAWLSQPNWTLIIDNAEVLVMWDYDGSRMILAATDVLT